MKAMIMAHLCATKVPICARITSACTSLRNPLRAIAPKPFKSAHPLHRAQISIRAMSTVSADTLLAKNKENPVIVYSKTYCPYCSEVKSLFKELKVPAKVVELDDLADGDAVQSTLSGITGMRTVPQVFIGGKLVGGCDDTLAAYRSGQLKTLLAGAGISI